MELPQYDEYDVLAGDTGNSEVAGIKAVWLANGERIGASGVTVVAPDDFDGERLVEIRRTNGNTLTVRHAAVVGVER